MRGPPSSAPRHEAFWRRFITFDAVFLRHFYVLFFIEVDTWRVDLAGVTSYPDRALGDSAGPQSRHQAG
jgi:hypothetical protein